MSADTARDTEKRARPDRDREPLEATVVRYRNAPDRCTVTPPEVDGDRQFTAWLSVDTDALLGLSQMR